MDLPMMSVSDILDFQSHLSGSMDALAAFHLYQQKSATLFGHLLFTALRFDYQKNIMTRLYTNREDVNPTGGTKPIPSGLWADRIIAGGQPYIGRSRQDLREVFFDYEALWAIGCESVMNVPVRWQSQTVGSFNVLGRADQFDDDAADTFGLLAQFGVPLFLLS